MPWFAVSPRYYGVFPSYSHVTDLSAHPHHDAVEWLTAWNAVTAAPAVGFEVTAARHRWAVFRPYVASMDRLIRRDICN